MKRRQRGIPRKWAGFASVFTALGDEHRQRMLLMFGRGEELTIKQIADAMPLSRTAVSHHLRVLRDAGVLQSEKRHRQVFLRPDSEIVLAALQAVREYVREEW
jgi:DNA-binding transcriptional ArsR family regulator